MIVLALVFAQSLAPLDTVSGAQLLASYSAVFPCSGLMAEISESAPGGRFVRSDIGFFQAFFRLHHTDQLVGPGCQERLRSSDDFNRVMLPAIATYLREQGVVIQGIDVPRQRPVSWSYVRAVASRFFYAEDIQPNGHVRRYICAGQNGLAGLPLRDPVVEAFVYSAIFRDITSPSPDSVAIKESREAADRIARGPGLPPDSAARVAQVRAMLFDAMLRSEPLVSVLEREYQRIGRYLPFVIVRDAEVSSQEAGRR